MIHFAKALLRPIRQWWRDQRKLRQLERRFGAGGQRAGGAPHGLNAPLIVTLTSYPPRFRYLHLNLMSLLAQAVPADRVILWIAHEDKARLPEKVTALVGEGLEIRFTQDLRSFKKLIPALEAFPEAVLVTADDDMIYPSSWLSSLVSGYDPAQPAIVCHRAHRPLHDGSGFAPYIRWAHNVTDEAAERPSRDLLPVGVGGILYPPASLDSEVNDSAQFMRLCPHADDLWFWLMGRRKGSFVKRVHEDALDYVPGSQDSALMSTNWAGGNDRQLAALLEVYGKPGES